MSLMSLVHWPPNTEPAWPLILRLGARTSQPVELYGPNLPLRSTKQANSDTQSFLLKSSTRLFNSASFAWSTLLVAQEQDAGCEPKNLPTVALQGTVT